MRNTRSQTVTECTLERVRKRDEIWGAHDPTKEHGRTAAGQAARDRRYLLAVIDQLQLALELTKRKARR